MDKISTNLTGGTISFGSHSPFESNYIYLSNHGRYIGEQRLAAATGSGLILLVLYHVVNNITSYQCKK